MGKEDGRDQKGVTVKKSENFSEWYIQALTKSEFIDYTDVSGCFVFMPAAYAAWQAVTEAVDSRFKADGIEDVYFPLLIPEKLLLKEKEHFEGFVPEVAWVTQSGSTKLEERLAIRPTSEVLMYKSYSRWIRSWRDLPLRFNQWNNVVRWEFKHPTPFIRTREFLWNEGHSVFATKKEAEAERDVILKIYQDVLRDYLALPGIAGTKSRKETFPGAVNSYSIEHVMPDGWALQGPDFHSDGQNFAKAFEIKFLDKDGNSQYAFQNTYAITTRELGVMVAVHGDDKGLILPPKLAYIQVVIVPIYRKEAVEAVRKAVEEAYRLLKRNYRVRLDDREGYSPGFKFSEWELRGVPIRIEIGPRDAGNGKVIIVRRDTGEKRETNAADADKAVAETLELIHNELYKRAETMLKSSVHAADGYDAFKKILFEKGGIIHAPWCGDQACEDKIKEETGAKITNIPFEQEKNAAKCIYCGKEAKEAANFAKSY
ncbi:MAG: proline--tRNA ligase [Candidatus Marsarchaeota archaeon]|nr:proline--tRNA ligase [Candidatus Marsarchaeota archaeon]